MKRIFSVLMCLLLLAGCGNSSKDEYYGIWKAYKISSGDLSYTVEELEALDDYEISDTYLQIRSGNSCVMSTRDGKASAECKLNGKNLTISDSKGTFDSNEGLKLPINGATLYFNKISNSQLITDLPVWEEETEETTSEAQPDEVNEDAVEDTTEVESENTNEERTGMSQEFLDAMNSYEEFMDEYCSFMDKYSKSDDTTSLLMEYTSFMAKYAKAASDFEKWEDENMTEEELAYYTDVNLRVTQKLMKFATNN